MSILSLRRSAFIVTSCAAFIAGTPLLVSCALSAQTQPSEKSPAASTVFLRVQLRQEDERPVVGAEISVKDTKAEQTLRSDSTGTVRLEGLRPGYVEIRVRLIGFKQTQLLARVAEGNNDLTIHVDGAAVVLDEMRIVGNKSVLGRHEDFDMRAKRSEASTTITADQIEKRKPIRLSQMLRNISGVQISEGMGHTTAISRRGKNPTQASLHDCVMRVMIDGVVMPPDSDLDQIVPEAAYGIEVFNGPAAIPVKLQGSRSDQWCGLIAIWTR